MTKQCPNTFYDHDYKRISFQWVFFSFHSATAMEVPRRSGKNRNFVGVEPDGSSVVVHSVPIAERYFMCHPRAVLQQVKFEKLCLILIFLLGTSLY